MVPRLNRDPATLEALYREHADALHAYLRTQTRTPQDAEDLTLQTFLEAFRDLERFRGDASEFRAWLFRIARNRAVDLGRRIARRREDSLDALAGAPGEHDTEAEAIARAERARLLRAVDALPRKQRQVILLRLTADLTGPEIARVLRIRPNAVKALHHRALRNLARALGVPDEPPQTL